MNYKDLMNKINLPVKHKAEDTLIYDLTQYESIKINNQTYIFNKDVDYVSLSNYGILLRKGSQTVRTWFKNLIKDVNVE